MSEEILVNTSAQETRVALLENGVLKEVAIERARNRGLVGNIYCGRVSRVLPGMGAAFLEIGLSRTAFLHMSDVAPTPGSTKLVADGAELTIDRVLKEGQPLLVQVTKDPLGSKGARLTTQLSVASRYLVLMPHLPTVGISQRIEDEDERARLHLVMSEHAGLAARPAEQPADLPVLADALADTACDQHDPGATPVNGYIVRTAAEGVTREELVQDARFLARLWKSLRADSNNHDGPALVYEDLSLVLRTMRDSSTANIDKVRIDSHESYLGVCEFVEQFVPELVGRIEHYSGERPIFDLYSVEDEIHKALQRKVDLKSGGHIVIDQTEAMTTIDVNTGGFVGARNLEETIFKTNLEATQAIARQLRLRNLGGIVIVDFIDMSDPNHQQQVLNALERNLSQDNTKTTVSEITSLGLVEITRKRTRESLEHVLCEPCPICKGGGSIKTVDTVCLEILREILREARQFNAQKLLVVASSDVVDRLLEEEFTSVLELEKLVGRPIRFQAEKMYAPDQYDVVLL